VANQTSRSPSTSAIIGPNAGCCSLPLRLVLNFPEEPAGQYATKANSEQIEIGMDILIRALITFVVVLLVLYLVNMLPIKGRAKEIVRVIVIIIGILSLLSYIVNF
jgi:hypothetical protein